MKLHPIPPAKALNKAYLKQSLKREQVELFKSNLSLLFSRVNEKESEENLKTTLVEGGFVGRDNLHIALPKEENCHLHYILGILNSKLTDFTYSIMNPEKGEALAQVKKQHVEQLPIPAATDAQKAPLIERVQKILADPDSPDVPQLEAEIDRLTYELYGLTEEEIALVEGS